MAARRFAEDSSVPVDRSRAEIRGLLAAWGCSGMGWTDHFAEGDVELGFVWDPAIVDRLGKEPNTQDLSLVSGDPVFFCRHLVGGMTPDQASVTPRRRRGVR